LSFAICVSPSLFYTASHAFLFRAPPSAAHFVERQRPFSLASHAERTDYARVKFWTADRRNFSWIVQAIRTAIALVVVAGAATTVTGGLLEDVEDRLSFTAECRFASELSRLKLSRFPNFAMIWKSGSRKVGQISREPTPLSLYRAFFNRRNA
jgi:hypothetical protein